MRYSRMTEEVKEERKSGKIGGIILILFALGAVIYMIGAAKVGSFLSEKIIRPVVDFFDEDTPKITEQTNVASEVNNVISSDISFPSEKIWLLQVGVFSEQENAKKSAEEIALMGGAGYIMEDNGDYRVIIAGYGEQSDAENVKERLKSEQNIESKILELSAESAVYTLESQQDVIDTFKEAAEECGTYCGELMSLSLQMDKGELSAEDVSIKLSETKDKIEERSKFFTELSKSTEDELVKRTQKFFEGLNQEFSAYSGELSDIELSSSVKHSYVAAAVLYRDFLKNTVV